MHCNASACFLIACLAGVDTSAVLAADRSADSPLLSGPRHERTELASTCIDMPDVSLGSVTSGAFAAGCSVSSFEQFASFEGLNYYRALYCLWPHWLADEDHHGCNWNSYQAAAQAIFVGQPGQDDVSVLFQHVADLGLTYFQEPVIVENRYGHWLHVNIRDDGNAHFNVSIYYHWDGAGWSAIDSESWLDALRVYVDAPTNDLEPGLHLRKGIWPDLSTMTASTTLYRPNECNACASGGWLDVVLGFASGSFIIESISHRPPDD